LKGEKPYGVAPREDDPFKAPEITEVISFRCRYYNIKTQACCAVGQWLKNPDIYANYAGSACTLFRDFTQNILKDEVQHILSNAEWEEVQCIHDQCALKQGLLALESAILELERSIGEPLTEIRALVIARNSI
jgi:hypothetical protein